MLKVLRDHSRQRTKSALSHWMMLAANASAIWPGSDRLIHSPRRVQIRGREGKQKSLREAPMLLFCFFPGYSNAHPLLREMRVISVWLTLPSCLMHGSRLHSATPILLSSAGPAWCCLFCTEADEVRGRNALGQLEHSAYEMWICTDTTYYSSRAALGTSTNTSLKQMMEIL